MIAKAVRRGRLLLPFALLTTGAQGGCARERTERLTSSVALHYVAGCAPQRVERVLVEALGDFPARPASFRALSLDEHDAGTSAPGRLDDLPVATKLYRLAVEAATYRGFAIADATARDQSAEGLLLPLGVPCTLPGVVLPARAGATLALIGGAVLVAAGASGSASGVGREAATISPVREPMRQSVDGLFVPRAFATGVSLGDEAWVVGGAQDVRDGAAALDTFERHDGKHVIALGRLAAARVRPAAERLLSGSVLVAGGRDAVAGAQLLSMERVDKDGGDGVLLASQLPSATSDLAMRARDDGRVWLGVTTPSGARHFLLDPESDGLLELSPPELPEGAMLSLANAVALPGGRVALLELSAEPPYDTTGRLWILLSNGHFTVIADFLPTISGAAVDATLPLSDGRILLAAAHGERHEARVIDVATRDARTRALPFASEALFMRPDGSALGVGAEGVWVLREDTLTPYDNPGGTLLADDVNVLALDAYGRFARTGLSLVANEADARFDLATLSYRNVRIDVRARGEVSLLLMREDGASRSVAVGGVVVGPALCELAAQPGDAVRLIRREMQLEITVAGKTRLCALDGLTGPVHLAVQVGEVGAQILELSVVRE